MFRQMIREHLREVLQDLVDEKIREIAESHRPPADSFLQGCGRWVAPTALKAAEVTSLVLGTSMRATQSLTRLIGWETVRLGMVVGSVAAYYHRREIIDYVKDWWSPALVVEEAAPASFPDVGGPESLMKESAIRPVQNGMPSCVAKVAQAFEQDGKLVYRAHGNCVRVGAAVFMPKHLTEVGRVFILSNIEANMKANKNTPIEYEEDNEMIQCVDDDLLMIKLSEAEMSILGLKKPSVCPVPVGINMQSTAYTRALSQSSSGMVRGSTAFGVLNYTGSTTKGWSGGVYVSGTRVQGMHYYGNPNKGYSAAYLEFLQRPGKPESSFDWFEAELDRVGESEAELFAKGRVRDWGIDSVIYTDQRGNVHEVDREIFNKVLSAQRKRLRGYLDGVDETASNLSGPEGLNPADATVAFVSTSQGQVAVQAENSKRGGSSDSSPQEWFANFNPKNQKKLMKLVTEQSLSAALKQLAAANTPKQ